LHATAYVKILIRGDLIPVKVEESLFGVFALEA